MNHFLFVALVIFCSSKIYAQGTLETIFYRLPSKYVMAGSMEDRKIKMEEMKSAKTFGEGSFIDEKNGFLRWTGYQCAYELCYWKNYQADSTGTSDKNLVAVVRGCMDKPEFLVEQNGSFTEIVFEVFENFTARHFFKRGVKSEVIKPYLDHFSFTLPHIGKNITAHYGELYGDKQLAELLAGDKIDFIYKDGTFTLGKPYF